MKLSLDTHTTIKTFSLTFANFNGAGIFTFILLKHNQTLGKSLCICRSSMHCSLIHLYKILADMWNEQVFNIKGVRHKSMRRINYFIVCCAFTRGHWSMPPLDSVKQLPIYLTTGGMLTWPPTTLTETWMPVYKTAAVYCMKVLCVIVSSETNWLRKQRDGLSVHLLIWFLPLAICGSSWI